MVLFKVRRVSGLQVQFKTDQTEALISYDHSEQTFGQHFPLCSSLLSSGCRDLIYIWLQRKDRGEENDCNVNKARCAFL